MNIMKQGRADAMPFLHLCSVNNINTGKKYITKLIINKNEYIINLYEIVENFENDKEIKIAYNNNKFIITKGIITSNGEFKILYDMTFKYTRTSTSF